MKLLRNAITRFDNAAVSVCASMLAEGKFLDTGLDTNTIYLAGQRSTSLEYGEDGDFDWQSIPRHEFAFFILKRLHDEGRPINEENFAQAPGIDELENGEDFDASNWLGLYRRAELDPEINKSIRLLAAWGNASRDACPLRKPGEDVYEVEFESYNYRACPKWVPIPRSAEGDATPFVFPRVDLSNVEGATEQVLYDVSGIVASRQPGLVIGAPKTLKTTIGCDLALSIATATPFLNRFTVPRACNVLFASGESGEPTLRETIARIAKSKGLTQKQLGGLTLTTKVPRFYVESEVAAFKSLIAECNARFVLIDPFAMGRSAAAATIDSVAYQELGNIAEACAENGATVVIIAHSTKNTTKQIDLNSAAGAGVSAWTRQWLTVSPEAPFKPATGEHRLRMTVGGSAGHSGEWIIHVHEGNISDPGGRVWNVRCEDITPRRQQSAAKQSGDAQSVLDALRASGPATKTAIRKALAWSGDRFNPAIDELLANGRIVTTRVRVADKVGREFWRDAVRVAESEQPAIPA